MRVVLVAIGYNREADYKRLLDSLLAARYGDDTVDLVMSIDKSDVDAVEAYASTVIWPYGSSTVRTFPQRQGLKQHILSCGSFLNDYDAAVILEDDIVVSPAFYEYIKQCYAAYADDDAIAGISLYGDLRNKHCQLPFTPQPSCYDVYFTQNAQSWGQVWLKKQWHAFMDWYKTASQAPFEAGSKLPGIVNEWGEQSWLKYHLKYCAETGKYFVTPYASVSTCFSAVGEHTAQVNTAFQVPLLLDAPAAYRLPAFGADQAVYYDAFFERQRAVATCLGLPEADVKVDLYGIHDQCDNDFPYVLTSRRLPYKVVATYGRQYKPHELNVLLGCAGNDIALYDTTIHSSRPTNMPSARANRVNQYMYFHSVFSNTKLLIDAAAHAATAVVRTKLRRK